MWKLNNFNSAQINTWYEDNSKNGFLKYEKPIITLLTPFEVEITNNCYNRINEIYKNDVETGGIIFCKIKSFSPTILETVYVEEVPNVLTLEERKEAYRPHSEKYLGYLTENFSKTGADIYFPMHFHTHPTKSDKASIEYSNSFIQLNTSEPDQNIAKRRFVEFNMVKLRYLSAIITGSESGHNILIYCDGVTPLDFFEVKFNRLRKELSQFSDKVSNMEDDKDLQKVYKAGIELVGLLFIGLNSWSVDHIPLLLEEKEYFGSLNSTGSTTIKIPIPQTTEDV